MSVSLETGVVAVPFLQAIPGCSLVARMTILAGSCYLRTAVAVAVAKMLVEVAAVVVAAAAFEGLSDLRSARSPQQEDTRHPVK